MLDTDRVIVLDHSYSQHWSESYKSDRSHATAISWILQKHSLEEVIKNQIPEEERINSISSKDGREETTSDEEVDVESLDDVLSPSSVGMNSYDTHKAKKQITESNRIVQHIFKYGKAEPDEVLWTSTLDQSTWSMTQLKLFNKVMSLLDEDKLSRLSSQGVHDEAVIRRLSIDKSASKLRYILSEYGWDQKLCQWIHNILFHNLPPSLLSGYLDIMQTLRSKIPALVERMILSGARDTSKYTSECLNLLLKRPWEPSVSVNAAGTFKNLRFSPSVFILFLQCLPIQSTPSMSKRMKQWLTGLGHIGKVVQINPPDTDPGITLQKYLQQLAIHLQNKVQSIKLNNPGSPVVLAGWDVAAIFNCHMSLIEQVNAIVCLGFPLFSANGSRADVDDDLCGMTTPTMFVVGEEDDNCNLNELEDMRERLLTKARTSLVAIAGANQHLCVSQNMKMRARVTQSIVDKMIIERIGMFLKDVIKGTSGFIRDAKLADCLGKRRRTFDDFPGAIKKTKSLLSANMVSQIRDALSGHKNISKDNVTDSKSPVQGVSFNLQSGTVSSLTTVPTSLGVRLPKDTSTQQKRSKHSKKKHTETSLTIDISKDTKKQIDMFLGNRRETSGPTLVPNEQQTDAAVASILGMDTPSDNQTEMDTLPSLPETTSSVSVTETSASGTSRNISPMSAFTRLSPSSISSLTNIVPSISPQNASPLASKNPKPQTTFGHLGALCSVATQPIMTGPTPIETTKSYGKFLSSNVGGSLSTIDTSALGFSTNTTSARSSKDEKETLQATAILEQLSSEKDSMTSLLSRRHSLDPTLLNDSIMSKKTTVKTNKAKKAKSNVVKRRQSIANPTIPKATISNRFKYVVPAAASAMIGNNKQTTTTVRQPQQSSSQFIIASSVSQSLNKPIGLHQAGGISIMEIKPTSTKAKPRVKTTTKSYPLVHFPQPNKPRINLTKKPGQGFALVSLPSSMFKTRVNKTTPVTKFAKTTVQSKTIVTTSSVQQPLKVSETIKTDDSDSARGIVHLRNKALIINKKIAPGPSFGSSFTAVKKPLVKPTGDSPGISGLRKVISPVRVTLPIERGSPTVILKKLSSTTVENAPKNK